MGRAFQKYVDIFHDVFQTWETSLVRGPLAREHGSVLVQIRNPGGIDSGCN